MCGDCGDRRKVEEGIEAINGDGNKNKINIKVSVISEKVKWNKDNITQKMKLKMNT